MIRYGSFYHVFALVYPNSLFAFWKLRNFPDNPAIATSNVQERKWLVKGNAT
jgi:hypothetical protein